MDSNTPASLNAQSVCGWWYTSGLTLLTSRNSDTRLYRGGMSKTGPLPKLTENTAHKDKSCIQITLSSVQTLQQRCTFFFKHSPGHREDSPINVNQRDIRATGSLNVSNTTSEFVSKTAQRQLRCKQPNDDTKCLCGQTVCTSWLTLTLKTVSISTSEAPSTSLQWIK